MTRNQGGLSVGQAIFIPSLKHLLDQSCRRCDAHASTIIYRRGSSAKVTGFLEDLRKFYKKQHFLNKKACKSPLSHLFCA